MNFMDTLNEGVVQPSEKEELDLFVTEYLKDYDPYNATIRMNYDGELALERSKQFWEHPYVQKAIAEVAQNRSAMFGLDEQRDINQLPDDFQPTNEEQDKQRIVTALFREAFYRGAGATHSARVAALCKLSGIYKLEVEKKSEGDGRSVMVVPAVPGVDDWESTAAAQQEKLKEEVKR